MGDFHLGRKSTLRAARCRRKSFNRDSSAKDKLLGMVDNVEKWQFFSQKREWVQAWVACNAFDFFRHVRCFNDPSHIKELQALSSFALAAAAGFQGRWRPWLILAPKPQALQLIQKLIFQSGQSQILSSSAAEDGEVLQQISHPLTKKI